MYEHAIIPVPVYFFSNGY